MIRRFLLIASIAKTPMPWSFERRRTIRGSGLAFGISQIPPKREARRRRDSCYDTGMNLILLEARELAPDGLVRLTGVRARHIISVLKAAPGDDLRVGVVDGAAGSGRVTSVEDDAVGLECVLDPAPPPVPPVDLLLALPRPKVMRRLWPQLAALGVGRIIITNAERVERDYFDTHVLSPETYRPLLVEGLQQARDTRLPLVSINRRFRPLVEDELDGLSDAVLRLAAQPGLDHSIAAAVGPPRPPGSDLDFLIDGRQENRDLTPGAGRVLLAVGPEGGWNDFEFGLLERQGFRGVSLGGRTLRSDTATVALLALAHEALRGRTTG